MRPSIADIRRFYAVPLLFVVDIPVQINPYPSMANNIIIENIFIRIETVRAVSHTHTHAIGENIMQETVVAFRYDK